MTSPKAKRAADQRRRKSAKKRAERQRSKAQAKAAAKREGTPNIDGLPEAVREKWLLYAKLAGWDREALERFLELQGVVVRGLVQLMMNNRAALADNVSMEFGCPEAWQRQFGVDPENPQPEDVVGFRFDFRKVVRAEHAVIEKIVPEELSFPKEES